MQSTFAFARVLLPRVMALLEPARDTLLLPENDDRMAVNVRPDDVEEPICIEGSLQ